MINFTYESIIYIVKKYHKLNLLKKILYIILLTKNILYSVTKLNNVPMNLIAKIIILFILILKLAKHIFFANNHSYIYFINVLY